ncbi:hypothetical protein PVAP13_7NG210134 [Panicum virgatum]|uniref:Uncharacterized protein n=1 Tax=Panicum virgatum TaxID=38727 RepID=A0A8T0PWW0_PANVG|nr:hypothetical protein PVAP13_7NG210134 [Panicum virgatum]
MNQTGPGYSEAESWLFPRVTQAASTAAAPPPWGSTCAPTSSAVIHSRIHRRRPYLTKYREMVWGTGVDASSMSHPRMGPAALDPATEQINPNFTEFLCVMKFELNFFLNLSND